MRLYAFDILVKVKSRKHPRPGSIEYEKRRSALR